MANQWYYSNNGKQHGPVSAVELKHLADSGRLLPTDFIWKEGMPDWKPASNAKGLFSSVNVPSPPPLPIPGTFQVGVANDLPRSSSFLHFICPHCNFRGVLTHNWAGREALCIGCGKTFIAPPLKELTPTGTNPKPSPAQPASESKGFFGTAVALFSKWKCPKCGQRTGEKVDTKYLGDEQVVESRYDWETKQFRQIWVNRWTECLFFKCQECNHDWTRSKEHSAIA